MAEKKENVEMLRKEVEDSKVRLEQEEHQLIRTENKIAKLGTIERARRTHMLCTKAGDMEHFFPVIKDASKTDFIQFCEGLLKIPGVKEYARNFKPKPIGEVMQ